uniref:ZSWIM1/3 RNaseH-like domain-containing protein n=1 Tax=Cyprinus carpio carpio TaxID=630221 RepID=A0A9J8CJY9_CYPCA
MTDQTKTTLDWLPACFKVLKISRTHVSGFITNKADLSTVLECHKRETLTSFVAWSDDKRKKEQGPHRLVWQVEDLSENVPLAVTNRVIHCCQHGNPRNNCKNLELSTEHEHVYSGKRKRMYIQTTKKVGCTAKLFIRYIRRFDKFSVEKGALKKRKQIIMDTLKTALQKNEAESSEIIHISLPLETAHQHHKISAESGYTRNIHPLVKKKIQEYVSLGITSVPFLKKVLRQFVNTELSPSGCVTPKSHDQCYFPASHTIQNHVHLALVAGKYSGLDQLNLEIKLKKWKEDDPTAHFFFRKCSEAQIIDIKTSSQDGDCVSEDKPTMLNTFLFVHQSQEQQRLLKRYGDMVLLDATYRTTKYALPLFLVVVRTNVGYKPVAEFICENESIIAISEALSLIKKWNDAWNPKYFMTDYCEQEYQALQLVFPHAHKYLCAFHREQAWIRWTRESKNHLSDQDRSELLGLLRSVASAHDRETCEADISKLRDSVLYKTNTAVRNYVEKRWLVIKERWCRGFSPNGFNVSVNTNNGIEAMNNSLKSFYLKILAVNTRSTVLMFLSSFGTVQEALCNIA